MNTKKQRGKRGTYSGEKSEKRRKKQVQRQQHIQSIERGDVVEELPDPLVPEVFNDIKGIYWECLKSIPDPRDPYRRVYPLYLILHRINRITVIQAEHNQSA